MRVLSLFDGISCGRYALERAEIPVTCYMASEIDTYAIKVARSQYPDTIQLGDVKIVRQYVESGILGKIDLLIGGSPCQGFSFAGKQLAFDDPRSALFFEYAEILSMLKQENPQIKFMLENVRMKREHLDVITNILGVEPVFIDSAVVSAQNRKRYYWCNWTVSQPADRGIMLKDIIESGEVDRDKSYCIDANYYKGGSLKNYLEKSRRQLVHCQSEKRLMVKQRPRGNNSGFDKPMDKSPALTGHSQENNLSISEDGFTYRKLTPIECERLQGLPDNYTACISNTRRYHALGNGWQVDTVEHIFREMNK